MQKFIFQIVGLTLLTGTLLFNACTDDTTGGGGDNDVAPQASLVAESGVISDNAQVEPNAKFVVKLRTTPGSNQIKTIGILEEGVKLATNRFTVRENGTAITSNNPLLVLGTSKGGSVYELTITAHSGESTKRYTFEVTDDDNLTDQVTIDITTKVVELTGKLLLNQDGPAKQGGLDLDTGESVEGKSPTRDTSYYRAEINDEGINTDLALDKNWRQRISAVEDNKASIRYPGSGLPENFNYAGVTTYEQAKAAYDSGKAFTAADPRGGTEKVSEVVKVGEVFLVKRENNYYVIKVTKITVTPNDNRDSYEFSIKRFYP
ncbi:MAG: hypothetical protein ACK4TA_16055 [Saprospiraceae bacterium]